MPATQHNALKYGKAVQDDTAKYGNTAIQYTVKYGNTVQGLNIGLSHATLGGLLSKASSG